MNNNIAVVIEDMFRSREAKHHCRGLQMFSTGAARTKVKYRCVSALGVKLCHSLLEFQKTLKRTMKDCLEKSM